MRTTVALLLALVLGAGLTACSDKANDAIDDAQARASEAVDKAQDVDWEAYPDQVRDKIEKAIADADCEGLNEQLDKLDEGKDTELIAFLKDQVEDAGCA
jgi:hypothetical protein